MTCSATPSQPRQRYAPNDRGGVHQHVDTTEALQCKVDHARDLRGIAQVGMHGRDFTALDALAHTGIERVDVPAHLGRLVHGPAAMHGHNLIAMPIELAEQGTEATAGASQQAHRERVGIHGVATGQGTMEPSPHWARASAFSRCSHTITELRGWRLVRNVWNERGEHSNASSELLIGGTLTTA